MSDYLPITDQYLDEIEARCNAATPGPWVAGRGDVATIVDGYESKWIYAKDRYLAIASGYEIPNWEEVMANARFIAASSTDIPRLVAEVRRLRAELATYQSDIEAGRLVRSNREWVPISDRLPNPGDVVEIMERLETTLEARYEPEQNEFLPWLLIDYPEHGASGIFRRDRERVTHWRAALEKEATQ